MTKRFIHRTPGHPSQRGMSLVEIMVAMIAGLILMAGVGQLFTSSKKTADVQDTQARLQENARLAMQVLARSVRESGYIGCSSRVGLSNVLNPAVAGPHAYSDDYQYEGFGYAVDARLSTIAAIFGFEWTAGAATDTAAGNWTPALDASITSPSPGSDVLTVRGPLGEASTLQQVGAAPPVTSYSGNANLTVGASPDFSSCDIVLVSNCTSAVMLQVTNDPVGGIIQHATNGCTPEPGPDNAVDTLNGNVFSAGDSVVRYGTTSFYVRTGGGTGNTEPTLYRRVTGGNAEEIVEGVEQMQIRYGEDTEALPVPVTALPDFTPNRYVTADQVADWRRVVSVRISLLLRTREDNVAATPQTYTFNGAAVTAPDRRLRQVFTTTLGVRNRLP
ncbi:PilW family protein [Methylomagnum sp.]